MRNEIPNRSLQHNDAQRLLRWSDSNRCADSGNSEMTYLTQPAPLWTQENAITLCRVVESICTKYDCHVALTGGTLYKDGDRKDCDILFYRIRQAQEIDIDGLIKELCMIGFEITGEHGWVKKATFNGKSVDMFFPENFPEICEEYGSSQN